jgi:hypothetical protein
MLPNVAQFAPSLKLGMKPGLEGVKLGPKDRVTFWINLIIVTKSYLWSSWELAKNLKTQPSPFATIFQLELKTSKQTNKRKQLSPCFAKKRGFLRNFRESLLKISKQVNSNPLTKLLALAKKTETLYQKTCKERDFVFPC